MIFPPKIVIQSPQPTWTNWLPILISALSLFVALVSLSIAYLAYCKGKPNLCLTQSGKPKTSVIIEPEWDNKVENSPDLYENRRYRLISEVVLRNKSSNPVAINSFTLNNFFEYNQYSQPGLEYSVELVADKIELQNGLTISGVGESGVFRISEKWLKPTIRLEPFDVKQGYLFWPLYEQDLDRIKIGSLNTLTVSTTFGTFEYQIMIDEIVRRDKKLSKRKKWDIKPGLR